MASQPLSLTVDASLRERSRRSSVISLVASTLVQGVAVGALIVTPLMVTTTLPAPVSRLDLPTFVPVVPAAPPPPPKPAPLAAKTTRRPKSLTGELVAPAVIAEVILDEPTSFGAFEPGEKGGVPGGDPSSLMPPELFEPAPTVEDDPEPLLIGGEVRPPRKLVHVNPIYPSIATRARVEGRVVLQAIIDKEGHVVDLTVVKSVPLLDAAAMEAVRQWKYEPTVLNGRPVPVIMSVTIEFELRRGR